MKRESEHPLPKITADLLSKFDLFSGLDNETLSIFAKELRTEHVEPGHIVVHEGDPSAKMFIVINGELEVVKHGKTGHEVRVALLGPTDWFGEMAVLNVQPRSATVRSIAPTVLMTMTKEDCENFLQQRDVAMYARLMLNMASELSRRLRVADGVIAQIMTSTFDTYMNSRRHTSINPTIR